MQPATRRVTFRSISNCMAIDNIIQVSVMDWNGFTHVTLGVTEDNYMKSEINPMRNFQWVFFSRRTDFY